MGFIIIICFVCPQLGHDHDRIVHMKRLLDQIVWACNVYDPMLTL